MKMLHIAHDYEFSGRVFSPIMLDELQKLGELTMLTRGDHMSEEERAEHIRRFDILLTAWGSSPTPDSIAEDPGSLKYILNITGTMRGWIHPCHIASGIPVTNWGDAQAPCVAEGAMALLLAVIKNVRGIGKLVEGGAWGPGALPQTSLAGLRVGIYGLGEIGRKFVEYIVPYNPVLTGFDPYVDERFWPAAVRRVESLDALFESIDCLVIHAGMSPETRHTVTARLLKKLPDDGIVVNTARGGIIDQAALMDELYTGRLRAGLDVLDSPESGDMLLLNDPARHFPNLTLSCHAIGGDHWPRRERLELYHQIALDNIRRFLAGKPLRFLMDEDRYERST